MIVNILAYLAGLVIIYVVYTLLTMLVFVPVKIKLLKKKYGNRIETSY